MVKLFNLSFSISIEQYFIFAPFKTIFIGISIANKNTIWTKNKSIINIPVGCSFKDIVMVLQLQIFPEFVVGKKWAIFN